MEGYHNSPLKSTDYIHGPGAGTAMREHRPGPGPDASLGIPGKSCNPPPSDPAEQRVRRVERWALQAASREILDTKALRTCCHAVIPQRQAVDIWKSKENFHYGGLLTCGSVWVCPVCAGKISERRRVELKSALDTVLKYGGSAQLWTFTAPHNLDHSLNFLLDAMHQARRKMLNRKSWKRLISSLGVFGTIRGLEVTHSFKNGWHVHFHVLAFLSASSPESLGIIEDDIYSLWRSACSAAGLSDPSREHGVKVEDGQAASQYIGKWGLEHEMTKSHIKKGKEGHHTPFDFLRLYLAGDSRYSSLFKEYATEFRGKRQLVWSDGLRDLLHVGPELTDEEIAARVDEDATKFASIPLNVWRVIVSEKRRGEVLEVCRQGLDAFMDYVIVLMEKTGST